MRARLPVPVLALSLGILAAGAVAQEPPTGGGPDSGQFRLTSRAFANGEEIPRVHTCEGKDLSPPLAWTRPPRGTRSLALVVEDPDAPDPRAPRMTWVHWVLYDLPARAGELAAGVDPGALPAGTRAGRNDWKRERYGGPCPPVGRHRYFHRLYALDVVLPDLGPASRARVDEAMQGHVIGRAELVGTYRKKGR